MPSLDDLIREANALTSGALVPHESLTPPPLAGLTAEEGEARRVLRICNACRYCEGFCAVFPAMFRRVEFEKPDIHYLANLCHQCGSCLHGCQHAPPQEYMVNIPRALARVRVQTWTAFAWPAPLGRLYKNNGLVLSLALAGALALFFMLVQSMHGSLWGAPAGSFYAILPHKVMAGVFAPVFLFALVALGIGVARFWGTIPSAPATGEALGEAGKNILSLTYLGGGHGEGCNNADDAFSLARRRAHHAVFYGFLLCFAATATGTIWHYGLGLVAPYGFTSVPKILGVTGGVLLVAGCVGLYRLNVSRHPLQGAPERTAMDRGFIALLGLTGASGLALAFLRGQPALPVLLAVHLGLVMALFVTMPYSKFAHGVYRSAALLKWAIEKRQPSKLQFSE